MGRGKGEERGKESSRGRESRGMERRCRRKESEGG